MRRTACLVALWLACTARESAAQHHGLGVGGDRARDPSTAALLSIQPLPVDAGSFYAGNWRQGILYTATELAMLVPAVVVLDRNGWWRGMHDYPAYAAAGSRPAWTTAERTELAAWLAGYIVVKVVSAFDAAHTVDRQNRGLALRYDGQARVATVAFRFPLRNR